MVVALGTSVTVKIVEGNSSLIAENKKPRLVVTSRGFICGLSIWVYRLVIVSAAFLTTPLNDALMPTSENLVESRLPP
jgi:hypothetical protein